MILNWSPDFQRWNQQPFFQLNQGLDVSDAGGVFDLICEQLDGETLSAKGIGGVDVGVSEK